MFSLFFSIFLVSSKVQNNGTESVHLKSCDSVGNRTSWRLRLFPANRQCDYVVCVLVPRHSPRSSNLLPTVALSNVTWLAFGKGLSPTDYRIALDYLLTFVLHRLVAPRAQNPISDFPLSLSLFPPSPRVRMESLSLILPWGLSRWMAMTTSRNSLRLMTPSPSASYSVKTLSIRKKGEVYSAFGTSC